MAHKKGRYHFFPYLTRWVPKIWHNRVQKTHTHNMIIHSTEYLLQHSKHEKILLRFKHRHEFSVFETATNIAMASSLSNYSGSRLCYYLHGTFDCLCVNGELWHALRTASKFIFGNWYCRSSSDASALHWTIFETASRLTFGSGSDSMPRRMASGWAQ